MAMPMHMDMSASTATSMIFITTITTTMPTTLRTAWQRMVMATRPRRRNPACPAC